MILAPGEERASLGSELVERMPAQLKWIESASLAPPAGEP